MSESNQPTKIHVLYILTKLELGGAQKICLTLRDGVEAHGHQISLISGAEGVLVSQAQKHPNTFLLQDFKREISIRSIVNELKTFIKMMRIIKKIKNENPKIVVHTHSTKAGLLGRWAALFAGVKNRIHTVHGFGFHDHQSKLAWLITYALEFITAPITTHYICVSEKDLKYGCKLLPTFKKKCSIIRAATNADIFFTPAKKIKNIDEVITIGTVSCFKPQKNLLDLLEAFKHACSLVAAKELRLQIIGDGEMRSEIEAWIELNKMQNQISLVGWQRNVAQFMHQWDIFALSSLWEGLPMAVVEARFSKLPVIAYNVGGIYEVVKNNQNGFLIAPGNWQDLGEKIARVVADDFLRQRLSNFNDPISDFDNRSMISQHLKLYQRLV